MARAIAFILVRYSGAPTAPPARLPDEFRQMLVAPGAGSVYDFFREAFGGAIDIAGSEVLGWYAFPFSKSAHDAAIQTAKDNHPDPEFFFWRRRRIEDGLALAASSGANLNAFYGAAVIYEEWVNELGAYGWLPAPKAKNGHQLSTCVLDAGPPGGGSLGWNSQTIVTHEIGHVLGLEHSYRYLGPSYKSHQEYGDPWDIMSADNVFADSGPYGRSGPGPNSVLLRNGSALKPGQVLGPGQPTETLTIAPLHPLSGPGAKVVMIPDVPHWVPAVESKGGQEGWPLYLAPGYLTVEFRSATGWDSGLSSTPQANNIVLVHWGSSDPESAWWRRSVLLHSKGLRAGDSYIHPESDVQVRVVSVDPGTNATVRIGPAPSVELVVTTTAVDLVDEVTRDYTWPGISGVCAPVSGKAHLWRSHLDIDVEVATYGLASPVTLYTSVSGKSIGTADQGEVVYVGEVTQPDLQDGHEGEYVKSVAAITLEFTHTTSGLSLRNDPGNGSYECEVHVLAVDNDGLMASRTAKIAVEGAGWRFDDALSSAMSTCLQKAIGKYGLTVEMTAPIQWFRDIPDPTGPEVHLLAGGLDVQRLLTQVAGRPPRRLAPTDRRVTARARGWRPDRVELVRRTPR